MTAQAPLRSDTEQARVDLDAGTLIVTRAHGRCYFAWKAHGSRKKSTTPVSLTTAGEFFGAGCALVENETLTVRAGRAGSA